MIIPTRAGSRLRQRGLTLIGFILFGGVIALLIVEALRVYPLFLEYFAIEKAIKQATSSSSTPADLKRTFEKIASLNNITSVSGQDLQVERTARGMEASIAYFGWTPLFEDVYIVIEFRASSAQTSTKAGDS